MRQGRGWVLVAATLLGMLPGNARGEEISTILLQFKPGTPRSIQTAALRFFSLSQADGVPPVMIEDCIGPSAYPLGPFKAKGAVSPGALPTIWTSLLAASSSGTGPLERICLLDQVPELQPGAPLVDGTIVPPENCVPPTDLERRELSAGAYRFDPKREVPLWPRELCPRNDPSEQPVIVQLNLGTQSLDGQTPLRYLGGDSYLLSKDAARHLEDGSRWFSPLWPAFKLDPQLKYGVAQEVEVRLLDEGSTVGDELCAAGSPLNPAAVAACGVAGNREAAAELQACPDAPVTGALKLHLAAGDQDLLAALTVADDINVVSVRVAGQATLRNGTTSWVIQSDKPQNRSVHDRGVRGRGQLIGVIDDRIDPHHCFFADQQPPSPIHRKLDSYRSRTGLPAPGKADAHGTFVAGVAAGQKSFDPTSLDNGLAPDSRLAFTDLDDVAARGNVCSTLDGALQQQYMEGARLFNLSWGDDSRSDYSGWAYDIDRFTHDNEEALVVVATSNGRRSTTPENAKNALAVGAGRQAGERDYLGSGGKGPTQDGSSRRKPEIFAPGCRIVSAEARSSCGLVRGRLPDDDQLRRTADCATSWAAPAVAGAAALARQYYAEGRYPDGAVTCAGQECCTPSGALLKATLLNATVDMCEADSGGRDDGASRCCQRGASGPCATGRRSSVQDSSKYPTDEEGWGRLVLERSLFFARDGTTPGDSRNTFAVDVWNQGPDTVTSDCPRSILPPLRTDEQHCYEIRVRARCEPLKITLVWTDPPPAACVYEDPVVNDIDLIVKDPSGDPWRQYFCGNHIDHSTGTSYAVNSCEPAAYRDRVNNVEQVITGDLDLASSEPIVCLTD